MGQSKRQMEQYVEYLCECGEGCVLDYKAHSKLCPARKYIKVAFGIVEEKLQDKIWRLFSPIGFMMSLILLQDAVLLGKFGELCLSLVLCVSYAYIFATRYTRYHENKIDFNFMEGMEGFDNW